MLKNIRKRSTITIRRDTITKVKARVRAKRKKKHQRLPRRPLPRLKKPITKSLQTKNVMARLSSKVMMT